MLKKILVLGNNDRDTDDRVDALAVELQTINHGLIIDEDFVPDIPGYYHSSVADLPWGALVGLAQRFDEIVMLDQPRENWSNWKCLLGTFKVMCHLEKLGKITIFRENQNIKAFQYWIKLQEDNKSFCLYPWVNKFIKYGDLMPCARASAPVTKLEDLTSWKDDPKFRELRNKMLAGEKLPTTCDTCYYYEEKNIESYRQFESLDWVAKLGLNDISDLEKIDQPYYYEMHTSNICNIKCRGCSPTWSNQIDKEFRKFNISPPKGIDWRPLTDFSILENIDIDQLSPAHRVYFQGGEPTIMPGVLDFMKECVRRKKTEFELSMCTNGMVLSQEFLEVSKHFPLLNFSFSIDGFGKINDYWRWGSKWDKVIQNAKLVRELGHKLSINTVPGIYNVTNLHLLFEFLDQTFPDTAVYLQINYVDSQSVFNHPMPELAVESMEKCKKTLMYHSDAKSCKTCIDSLYDYYSGDPKVDLVDLETFFKFNDRLDEIRGSKLIDYIPELEQCRKFLKQQR